MHGNVPENLSCDWIDYLKQDNPCPGLNKNQLYDDHEE